MIGCVFGRSTRWALKFQDVNCDSEKELQVKRAEEQPDSDESEQKIDFTNLATDHFGC